MSTLLDADVHRAASYRNMVEHLTAPLQSGAVDSPVAIDETGLVQVTWSARLPLLLLAPLAPLASDALRVDATVPGGDVVPLDFAPYSEQGAFLPVYRPPVDDTGFAAPFAVQLAAPPLTEPELAATFEARLLEGNLGVMLYLLAAEKQRLRRQARELAAMRRLANARDDALDRTGAELGVRRFADTLAFSGGATVTDVRREPDDEYRRRLRLYRPWFLPTRARIDKVLNGPGAPADPNAGALGELGVDARFTLVETNNEFGVAMAIVGADDPAYRAGLLAFVRATHLIWPANNASANAVHAARFLPDAQRARVEVLRADLRKYLDFSAAGADAALAPMLADALARAGACRFALGASAPLGVLRAQADAGSRYELGLGADLAALSAQELKNLATAFATRTPNPDPEIEGLLASMTPQPPADDPDGRWLLEPCGLRTVHRVDSGTLYVSNLPVFGLTIAGPTQLQPAGWTQILAGRFSDRAFSDVLFYERVTGAGEFWSSDGRGGLVPFNQQTGWRTTWTTIVGGDFTTGPYDGLFFYERSTGSAELWSTDGAGNIALVRSYNGLRETWSAIVPGSFHPGSGDGLFFYDRSAGVGELYAMDDAGNLTLLAQHTDLGSAWTHVVAGVFTAGPLTDLLFYDRVTGTAEVYATDGNGGLALVRRLEQWEPGWTDVIPGSFGGVDGFTDLLTYNRDAGTAEINVSDGTGGLVRLRSFDDWGTTWTQIVPARFVRRPLVFQTSDLLFYERATGKAAGL